MYFASRVQAGRMLASQLNDKYSKQQCVVLALNDGGVMVGAQIAQYLHTVIMLLLSAEITLPRETAALAGITATGEFAYNEQYSAGEIEELAGEYRNFMEQQKLVEMHQLNHLLGTGGTLNRDLLKRHNIIIVSDGLKTGFPLDLAYQYLKPIEVGKIVVATPMASVGAVDRMHVLADDLYCLSVIEEYADTGHYYDRNDIPDHKMVVETIENIILNWR